MDSAPAPDEATVLAGGTRVFDAPAVAGRFLPIETPDDVLALMDAPDGATGVIALVRDAGATFLAPIYHELAGVVCTGGTPRSHIGIVSREFQVPCIMGAVFADGEPLAGTEVVLDCSATSPTNGDGRGVLRA